LNSSVGIAVREISQGEDSRSAIRGSGVSEFKIETLAVKLVESNSVVTSLRAGEIVVSRVEWPSVARASSTVAIVGSVDGDVVARSQSKEHGEDNNRFHL